MNIKGVEKMELLDLMIEIERYANRNKLDTDETTVSELIASMADSINED
jgi:hypothetical protein